MSEGRVGLEPVDLDELRVEVRAWLEVTAPDFGVEPGTAEPELVTLGRAWQKAKADARWAGLCWPTEVGGRGWSLREQVLWDLEVQRFPVPELVCFPGTMIMGPTIIEFGSAAQQEFHLGPTLVGNQLWCQLFSEPEAGSDLAGVLTRATRDGESWVINGQKVWTSGAHLADYALLVARTSTASKHGGLTCFLVSMDAPGIVVRPIRQIDGAAHFNEVFIDDLVLSDEAVIGGVSGGWSVVQHTLSQERLALASRTRVNLDLFLDLFARRGVEPLSGIADTSLRPRIGRLAIRARVADLIAQMNLESVTQGHDTARVASVGKLITALLVNDVAAEAMSLLGVDAVAAAADDDEAADWHRAYLAATARRIAGGTDEIQRSIIGERVLGLPREPKMEVLGRSPDHGSADGST